MNPKLFIASPDDSYEVALLELTAFQTKIQAMIGKDKKHLLTLVDLIGHYYRNSLSKNNQNLFVLKDSDNLIIGILNIYNKRLNSSFGIPDIKVMTDAICSLGLIRIFRLIFGFIILESSSKEEGVLYISTLAVNLKYQKRGYGKLLLKKAIILAKKLGCQAVCLHVAIDNYRAIKLYYNNGFRIVEKTTNNLFYNLLGVPGFYFMVKSLKKI